MEKQYTTLLYSKYSKYCTDLINLIENSNIDFSKETKLLPVCIDNDDIRKKIISSTNIEIDSVPTILIIYEDGGVEKYEGEDAFNWVNDIINKLKPQKLQPQPMQQPPMIQQPPMMQPQQPPIMQHQQPPMMQPQPMQQPQQSPMMQPQPMQQPQQSPMMQPSQQDGMTTIDDMEPELEPIYEDELDQYKNFNREDVFPPKNASLRTGASSYDVNTSFGTKKSDVKVVRGIKSNTTTDKPAKKGKPDIMSAALEMQKSREREEEDLPKAPFGL